MELTMFYTLLVFYITGIGCP